jgi:MHS family shikimate/dehydroshikimate transporter-like MFS transporter
VLVANFAHDPVVAVQQPLFTEMFEPSFRYSGAGFAYQLASAVAGGFTPLIAAAFVLYNGGGYPRPAPAPRAALQKMFFFAH